MNTDACRVVLGLNGWSATSERTLIHEAGAAVVVGGEVVAAINEERLSRRKNDGQFPYRSIEKVLEMAGVSAEDVDVVAVAGLDAPEHGARICRYLAQTLREVRFLAPRRIGGAFRDCLLRRRRGMPAWASGKVSFVEHHEAHAASAFFTSPWEEATVVTVDGVGDELCASVSLGRDGGLERLFGCSGYHSPGIFYSAVTLGLGFRKNRHEGKITGLAAYGNSHPHLEEFRRLIQYQPDRKRFFAPEIAKVYRDLSRNTPFLSCLMESGEPKNIAAAAQQVLEEIVTPFCRDAVQSTGSARLVLAGGIFANVKLNQRILALEEVENIYIHPNMGDGGLAVGAALAELSRRGACRSRFLPHVYLGPEWNDEEIRTILERQNRHFTFHNEIEKHIAELLAAGRVVGRFAGRMEYGPRALGNRSILARPSDPDINNWLNDRLQRTEFMPFAPSIIEEAASAYLVGWRPEDVAARFMTITYDTTARAFEEAPATVHVDRTARPQVVRQEDNPSYHAIISHFREKTGIAAIVNTSFNMHEEPIVCTPHDALRALDEGGVELLAINRFIVFPR